MTTFGWIVVVALVGVGIFVLTSPKLRGTVRAWFKGQQAQAADALDDAVNRMEAAEADVEENLAKANAGLIEVKTQRNSVEGQIADAQNAVTRYTNASENAAKAGRRDLVEQALQNVAEAKGLIAKLQPLLDALKTREQQVNDAVVALQTRKAELKRQKVDVKTRASTAKVAMGVNQLLAGVDLDGHSKDVDRAMEIVSDLEARANATGEVAATATKRQRLDADLEALADSTPSVTDQADALMAKYTPTAPDSSTSTQS